MPVRCMPLLSGTSMTLAAYPPVLWGACEWSHGQNSRGWVVNPLYERRLQGSVIVNIIEVPFRGGHQSSIEIFGIQDRESPVLRQMKVTIVMGQLVWPRRKPMHGCIPELPEIVGLRGIRVWKVALNERRKSWTVPKRWTQKPTQRFGRGEGTNEREECPVVVQ
jgi:hypothetical protein